MKINKSILTGMTALSLFATSAAAATSAVTPVVSNAAAKKSATKKAAVKHTYKFNWLIKAESKGHATHYFNTVAKFHITKAQMKKGWYLQSPTIYPYHGTNLAVKYRLKGNHIVRVTKGVTTFVNLKHRAINDKKEFLGQGTYRISKAEFNKLNKQQTR